MLHNDEFLRPMAKNKKTNPEFVPVKIIYGKSARIPVPPLSQQGDGFGAIALQRFHPLRCSTLAVRQRSKLKA